MNGMRVLKKDRGDEMKENKSKVLSILLFVSNGSIYLYPIPYIPFYVFHSMYFPLRVCPPIPCIPFYVSHFVYPNPCISHSPYASPMRVPPRFIYHISCNPCISHSRVWFTPYVFHSVCISLCTWSTPYIVHSVHSPLRIWSTSVPIRICSTPWVFQFVFVPPSVCTTPCIPLHVYLSPYVFHPLCLLIVSDYFCLPPPVRIPLHIPLRMCIRIHIPLLVRRIYPSCVYSVHTYDILNILMRCSAEANSTLALIEASETFRKRPYKRLLAN